MSDMIRGYRTIDVRCDWANDWMPPVTASTGDDNGRIIRVTLTDGGGTVEASGGLHAQLLVNPSPDDPGSFGDLVDMTPVEGEATATFEAPIPAGAVARPGRTRMGVAFLMDNDDGTQDVVCSRPFVLNVERGVLRVDSDTAVGAFEAAVRQAVTAATAAKASEGNAADSAAAAGTSESNARSSASAATAAAAAAKASESAAKTSESAAKTSESAAKTSESAAASSAGAAKASESAAKASATEAQSSASSAASSASAAKASESAAASSAQAAAASESGARAALDEAKRFDLTIGSVSTVDSGGQATASLSGDWPSKTLDLGLVQGPRGEGIHVSHVASDVSGLPASGASEGELALVGGELYAWDGSSWLSQGRPTVSGRDGIRVWKQWDDPALAEGNDVREGDLWMMTPHYLTDLDPDSPAEGAAAAEYYTYAEGVPDDSPSVLVMTRQVVVDLLERHLGCWWSLIWRVESSLTPGREETVQETAAVGMLSADPDWQALSAEVDALRIEVDRLKTQTQTQTK